MLVCQPPHNGPSAEEIERLSALLETVLKESRELIAQFYRRQAERIRRERHRERHDPLAQVLVEFEPWIDLAAALGEFY